MKQKFSVQEVQHLLPEYNSELDNSEIALTYTDRLINSPVFAFPNIQAVTSHNMKDYIDAGITPVIMPVCLDQYTVGDLKTLIQYEQWIKYTCDMLADLLYGLEHNTIDIQEFKLFLIYLDATDTPVSKVAVLIQKAKNLNCSAHVHIEIIVTPVISPEVFGIYAEAGADYCVLCSDIPGVPVSYPMGSLISDCHSKRKWELSHKSYIIADNITDIESGIKALALGADYIMFSSPMITAYESMAPFKKNKVCSIKLDGEMTRVYLLTNGQMHQVNNSCIFTPTESNKRTAIKAWTLDNSEKSVYIHDQITGNTIYHTVKCEYTIQQFMDSFNNRLKMTMRLTGHQTLTTFCGGPNIYT